MPSTIVEIFAEGTVLQLSGLVGMALFLILAGIREIRDERPEGYLYLTLAVFLTVAHAVLLENLLATDPRLTDSQAFNVWLWLSGLFAPALIALFVLRALFNFAVSQGRDGLVKLFFGLTLLCLIYMLGTEWPIDIKGILVVVWLGFFFKTELAIAN